MPIARFRAAKTGQSTAQRPGDDLMLSLADELTRHGFTVLDIGRFAVTAKGETQLFEELFGITLQQDKVLRTKLHNELNGLADLLEIAPPPRY